MAQTRNPGTASVGGDEQIRIFLGLRLPPEVVEQLAPWQERELGRARGIRLVPPENVHITLAFLGHRPVADVGPVSGCLHESAARSRPPRLTVCGYRETRSVGMLLLDDAGERAGALADDLHERLERIGVYRRERRPWLPHLTVVRFRDRPRLRPSLPELEAFSPSDAAVYHSVLRRGGAQYEVLETVRLGGG